MCFVTAALKVAYSRWVHRRYRRFNSLDASSAYKPTDEIPVSPDVEANAIPLPNVQSSYRVRTVQKGDDDRALGGSAAVLPSPSRSRDSIQLPAEYSASRSTKAGSEYKIAYIIGKEEALATSPSRTRHNSADTDDISKEAPPKDPPCQPAPGVGQHRSSTPQGAGKQPLQTNDGKDRVRSQNLPKDPWSPGRLLSFESLSQPTAAEGGAPSKKLQKRPKVRVRRSFDRKPASIESEKDCVWLADDAVWQPGRLRQHVSPACSLTNKESFNTVDLGLPEALHSMYPRRENRSSSDTVKAQEVARDDQEVHDPHRWVAPWHVCYGLPPVLPRLPSDHATRKSTSRASGTTNVLQKPKAFDGAGRQPVFSPRTASPPAVQRFYAKPFSFSSPGPVPDLELNSLPRHESNLHEHKHVHAIALLALAHHDHVVLDEDSQGLLSDTFPKAEAVPDKKGLPQAAESPEARTRPSRWLGLRPRTLRKVKRDAAMRRSYASGGSVSSRLEID